MIDSTISINLIELFFQLKSVNFKEIKGILLTNKNDRNTTIKIKNHVFRIISITNCELG